MSNPMDWDSLAVQVNYLKARGFDEVTIRRMMDRGMYIASQFELRQLGIERTHLDKGIVWVLKDIAGRPTGKYGARVWYNNLGFVPDDDKPKFLTPKGQVPGVYFTSLADWGALKYGQRIYLCESYLKADVLGMLGYHALGVSGCWGWTYEKQLNWDFETIAWRAQGFKPVVFMDSNVNPTSGLYQAASKFRAQFDVKYHVDASIIVLPGPGGDAQWGCDDYVAKHGWAALKSLLDGPLEKLPNEIREHLKMLNDEVCVITDLGKVVDIERGILMGKGAFEDVVYANRMAEDSEGKNVSVAKVWMRWDGRLEVREEVYRPGKERVVPGEFYNRWKGMGCEPINADVQLFTSWMIDVFPNAGDRDWILNWWAWQLQNLGGKLTTGLVIVGPPGVGKGWLSRIVQFIWGRDNVAVVPLTTLERHFNADVAAKQILIVEETDSSTGRNQVIYNKLKDIITGATIRLERKGVDAVEIENVLNVFLTGNQVDMFKLDNNDRRFAIFEASNVAGVANNGVYWKQRWDWLEREGGASAIYGYLLRRDVSQFDPYGEAPMTQAKRDMVEVTHHPIDKWVEELRVDYKSVMVVAGREIEGRLATAKELMWVYLGGVKPLSEIEKKEAEFMNRALKNARIQVANNGGKIKFDGLVNRYFLLEGKDESTNWAQEVRDRPYWRRLAASTRGQVASENGAGNNEEKW